MDPPVNNPNPSTEPSARATPRRRRNLFWPFRNRSEPTDTATTQEEDTDRRTPEASSRRRRPVPPLSLPPEPRYVYINLREFLSQNSMEELQELSDYFRSNNISPGAAHMRYQVRMFYSERFPLNSSGEFEFSGPAAEVVIERDLWMPIFLRTISGEEVWRAGGFARRTIEAEREIGVLERDLEDIQEAIRRTAIMWRRVGEGLPPLTATMDRDREGRHRQRSSRTPRPSAADMRGDTRAPSSEEVPADGERETGPSSIGLEASQAYENLAQIEDRLHQLVDARTHTRRLINAQEQYRQYLGTPGLVHIMTDETPSAQMSVEPYVPLVKYLLEGRRVLVCGTIRAVPREQLMALVGILLVEMDLDVEVYQEVMGALWRAGRQGNAGSRTG